MATLGGVHRSMWARNFDHNISSNESTEDINLAIPGLQRLKYIQSDASVYC